MECVFPKEDGAGFGVEFAGYAQNGCAEVVFLGTAGGKTFERTRGDEKVRVDFQSEVWREGVERGFWTRHCLCRFGVGHGGFRRFLDSTRVTRGWVWVCVDRWFEIGIIYAYVVSSP